MLTVFTVISANLEADRYSMFCTGNFQLPDRIRSAVSPEGRPDLPAAPRTFRIDRDQSGTDLLPVNLFRNGYAFFNVSNFTVPGVLGDDRTGQRIPGRQWCTGFGSRYRLHQQCRTVRYFMTFTLTAHDHR